VVVNPSRSPLCFSFNPLLLQTTFIKHLFPDFFITLNALFVDVKLENWKQMFNKGRLFSKACEISHISWW